MVEWLAGIWNEIKPNAKWDFIKWIFGGGVLATAIVLIRSASLYWRLQILVFVVSVMGFALVSIYQRSRHRAAKDQGQVSASLQDQAKDVWSNPRFELVTGRNYVNKTVEIDGKSFRDCSFEHVTLMFHGTAPSEMVGTNRITGGLSIDTDHPVAMMYSKLQRFARSIPGAQVLEGAVDAKGNVLPDKFEFIEVGGTHDGQATADTQVLASNPRIYIEIDDQRMTPGGAGRPSVSIVLRNEGSDVAHKVQIESLQLAGATVSFDSVEAIPSHDRKPVLANVDPCGVLWKHDLAAVLMKAWDATGQLTEEFPTPMRITYEDYTKASFVTTCDLVLLPIADISKRNSRQRNRGNPFRSDRETLLVKNLEIKRLS